MIGINLATVEIVVRVIKRMTVGLERHGSEDGVVHHALHAVAVARVASHSQKIAGQLEVSIGTTRRLEAGMGFIQAVGEVGAAGSTKQLVWTPTACREALGQQDVKAILRRPQIFLVAQGQISLHRRRKRIHVTVGVLTSKSIFAFGEWAEKIVVQITSAEFLVVLAGAALVRDELILRNRVRLIPGIRDVRARPPALAMLNGMIGHVA